MNRAKQRILELVALTKAKKLEIAKSLKKPAYVKGCYEQSCDDFALFSSPWQEHCEDSANYGYEQYAGDVDQYAWCEE